MKKIKIFAPATIANFIVGFDSLGASIEAIDGSYLGEFLTISSDEKFKLEITGKYAHQLPQDPDDNIITKCVENFHRQLANKKITPQNFSLILEKNLPVCSGLGSSASSIVAAIFALNTYYDKVFSDEELLILAGQMENAINGSIHYDNVAPCLLGGLQLITSSAKNKALPWFEDWFIIIYYPGIETSTKMAREILPKNIPLRDAVEYWQNFALFIDSLHSDDQKLAKSLFNDELIEPHRAKLIPNFDLACKTSLEHGAIAFGISGSGPTCFAIADSIENANKIQASLELTIASNEHAFTKICKINKKGARVI